MSCGTTGAELDAVVSDSRAPQEHVWRALTSSRMTDGCGTAETMRRARGVARASKGLSRDKMREATASDHHRVESG